MNKNDLTVKNLPFVKVFWGILLTEDDKKEEITVRAPSKSIIAPEKKVKKATEKALEEERYGILQVPKKTGTYIGVSSVFVGVTLFIVLVYMSLSGQVSGMFSSTAALWVLGLWIAVGLISVVAGFFLMGSE